MANEPKTQPPSPQVMLTLRLTCPVCKRVLKGSKYIGSMVLDTYRSPDGFIEGFLNGAWGDAFDHYNRHPCPGKDAQCTKSKQS